MATGLYHNSSNRMDSGDRYNNSTSPQTNSPRSPDSGSVGFHMPCSGYQVEERKKYLTAKYGSHQMKLIRKRLAVEDWLDTELRKLYRVTKEDDTYDCTIDLDEVLDLETEKERWLFLQEQVANSNQSPQVVNKFIQDVLEKADTL